MENYKKNFEILKKNHVYSEEMEHDACGVGLIASTEGKKSRKIVEYGIEALKAVWHRGAVDADGKTGDGAGIHVEIPKDFFIEKIEVTGHDYDDAEICVGMIFLPRNDYSLQEKCKTLIETELLNKNYYIYIKPILNMFIENYYNYIKTLPLNRVSTTYHTAFGNIFFLSHIEMPWLLTQSIAK